MSDELTVLKQIDIKLGALLGLAIDDRLRSGSEWSRRRQRSVDSVLSDAGLNGTEIAKLLGKTPQAVSQVLARETPRRQPRAQSKD